MSQNTIVAKRYAKALFEVAQEKNLVTQVQEELKLVLTVLEEDSDIKKFIQHPNIHSKEKIELLKKAFESQISPIVLNTLQLIILRRRESMLSNLLHYYESIADEALGQAKATVYTPQSLTNDESKKIADTFGKITGKKIHVENIVDRNLLGGIRVRIGDRLYDGSLATKLEQLKKTLVHKAL